MAVSSMELMELEPAPPGTADSGPDNERERPMFCTGDRGVVEGKS